MITSYNNPCRRRAPKTRVEKINEAIFQLFIFQEKSAREIKQELLNYDIDLSLVEILTIIAGFHYKPVKEKKKTATQLMRAEFKSILEPVMRLASEHGISNVKLCLYLNYHGIPYPSELQKPFVACKLDSLLIEYKFPYPRKCRKLYLPNEDMYKLINDNLTEEELLNLENWKRKINVEVHP